jgi:transcriptional regulator with XRE-family HTH domain
MSAKTKKGAKPPMKARPNPKRKQTWRTEVLQAARNALEYRIEDVVEKSGVNDKVVRRIMRGDYNPTFKTLESVVSSLHLEMVEIFDPKAAIAEVIKKVYERARLNREVKDIDGAVIALKPDGTLIAVAGK